MQVQAYSTLADEVLDIGPPSNDPDQILELGAFVATGREDVIVFVDPQTITLPLWKGLQ